MTINNNQKNASVTQEELEEFFETFYEAFQLVLEDLEEHFDSFISVHNFKASPTHPEFLNELYAAALVAGVKAIKPLLIEKDRSGVGRYTFSEQIYIVKELFADFYRHSYNTNAKDTVKWAKKLLGVKSVTVEQRDDVDIKHDVSGYGLVQECVERGKQEKVHFATFLAKELSGHFKRAFNLTLRDFNLQTSFSREATFEYKGELLNKFVLVRNLNSGDSCDFCKRNQGVFDPDVTVGRDFFATHANCHCTIRYKKSPEYVKYLKALKNKMKDDE